MQTKTEHHDINNVKISPPRQLTYIFGFVLNGGKTLHSSTSIERPPSGL